MALKNLICTQLNQNAAAAAAAAPAGLSTINPLTQLVVSGQASPAALNDQLLIVQQQQQQAAAAAAVQAATIVPAALPYQYYQGITAMYPTLVPVPSSDAAAAYQAVGIYLCSLFLQQFKKKTSVEVSSLHTHINGT